MKYLSLAAMMSSLQNVVQDTNCLASTEVDNDEDNSGDEVPRSWAADVDDEKG